MNGKKQQQGRACIFCGNRPLTEEEMWPKWIRSIYPKVGIDNHKLIRINYVGSSTNHVINITPKKISGHSSGRKLKVVCARCNNGWMSQIEETSIPILSKLILGEQIDLTFDDQKKFPYG